MKDILTGATSAVVASMPLALLLAILFRFPIPLAGYIGPFTDNNAINTITTLKGVSIAWVVYGILGGFIILSVAGGISGRIISLKCPGPDNIRLKNKLILISGVVIAFLGCGFLSILDYIIGPW